MPFPAHSVAVDIYSYLDLKFLTILDLDTDVISICPIASKQAAEILPGFESWRSSNDVTAVV
jgi:hypothetical protein